MTKKTDRVFRKGKLTPQEIARDADVRRKVLQEFPPAASSSSVESGNLSAALKDAIRSSNKSMCQIAQDAGVSQIVVSRFCPASATFAWQQRINWRKCWG